MRAARIASLLLCGYATAARPQAVDLLPDLVIEPRNSFATRIDKGTLPGRTLLRLSTATANVGEGRLEIRATAVIDATRREVVQRIYRSDGSFSERLAGTFSHHPEHGHFHFDGWTSFTLRAIGPEGEIGPVVADGGKQSFCLLDLIVHDASNPGFQTPGFYTTCGDVVQGITPGWSDLYILSLPGQWVDVTDLPQGVYWLEAIVDPEDRVVESNETNNALGRFVAVFPREVPPDRFEDDDSFEVVFAREEGAPNSANLGLLDSAIQIDDLTLDDLYDHFAFRLQRTGGPGSHVRVETHYEVGDIDLFLFTPDITLVGQSRREGGLEQVSLEGVPPGTYVVEVMRVGGLVPGYTLAIDPVGEVPPTIDVLRPEARGVWVERGFETVAVEWVAADPDGDETRVTLYVDRDGALDKQTLPVVAPGGLSGADGIAYVNTAALALGPWLVYAEVGDGRALSGDWAPGPFVVYEKGDLDLDGDVDRADLRAFIRILAGRGHPADGDVAADMDRDGDVDGRDIVLLLAKSRHERGHGPFPPTIDPLRPDARRVRVERGFETVAVETEEGPVRGEIRDDRCPAGVPSVAEQHQGRARTRWAGAVPAHWDCAWPHVLSPLTGGMGQSLRKRQYAVGTDPAPRERSLSASAQR